MLFSPLKKYALIDYLYQDGYVFREVCMSVCPSACLSQTLILQFLFLDGIEFLDGFEPFFGRQFSMTKTTKRSSIF